VQPKKELSPGSLFTYLDAYLRQTRTRLPDLFSKYDGKHTGCEYGSWCLPCPVGPTCGMLVLLIDERALKRGLHTFQSLWITSHGSAGDGDGELTLLEMASMLRDMKLSHVTNADILYFMVRQSMVFSSTLLYTGAYICDGLSDVRSLFRVCKLPLLFSSFLAPSVSPAHAWHVRQIQARCTPFHAPSMQALMDADGNGTISQDELLSSAKLVAEAHSHMHQGGGKTPQV